MENQLEFINGLIFKLPSPNQPEWAKGKLSIKKDELIQYLQGKEGDWVNVNLAVGKSGKPYASLDTWKPDPSKATQTAQSSAPISEVEDDLPF